METTEALPVGTELGDFRLESVIASSSTAITYKARIRPNQEDSGTRGKAYVIKECFPARWVQRGADQLTVKPRSTGGYENGETTRRFRTIQDQFERETEIVGAISAPNVVRTNSLIKAFNTSYVVTEYIEGVTFKEFSETFVRTGHRLGQADLEPIARKLIASLDLVHKAGVIHRDIKPTNILINNSREPFLIDFGAAKSQSEANSDISLTRGFAPPEQREGHDIGPWSDIFSLASTLYFGITLHQPGGHSRDLWIPTISLDEYGSTPPINDEEHWFEFGIDFYGVSKSFADAIIWARDPDRTRRPQTVSEWAKVLFREPAPLNRRFRDALAETKNNFTLPLMPAQGPGPHFAVSKEGVIDFAPPESLDRDGNYIERLRSLHSPLADAARDLVNGLRPRTNQYQQLSAVARKYLEQVIQDIERIDFAVLYGLGLRLEVADETTKRLINDGISPPLDEAEVLALRSLFMLHGPFILASARGQELLTDAERFLLRREDLESIRNEAIALGEAMEGRPDIVAESAAQFVTSTAETIGQGPHDERSTALTLHSVANISVIAGELAIALLVLGAGNLAAVGGAWALLKSRPEAKEALRTAESVFARLHSTVVERLKTEVPGFLLGQQNRLRRLAQLSPRLRFVSHLLDWLQEQVDKAP